MPKREKALIRLLKDPNSSTGVSAAILVRDIKPKRISQGTAFLIAKADFPANFKFKCEGFELTPQVKVLIEARLSVPMQRAMNYQKKLNRAIARAPMLT